MRAMILLVLLLNMVDNSTGSSPKEVSLLAVSDLGNVIELHRYD
jgi:hypothetical protein